MTGLVQRPFDPDQDVALIVATHWHDDHIRGIARLVELCTDARFYCASALCGEESLTLVGGKAAFFGFRFRVARDARKIAPALQP